MHPIIGAWLEWQRRETALRDAFIRRLIRADTFYIRDAEHARQWFNELMHRGVNECAATTRI